MREARHIDRWIVTRHHDAAVYQFIGYASQHPEHVSLIFATVLALDPEGRSAFLATERWIVLGDPAPELAPFDPVDVTRCAEAWLRRGAPDDFSI